jgi:hypothetical protein
MSLTVGIFCILPYYNFIVVILAFISYYSNTYCVPTISVIILDFSPTATQTYCSKAREEVKFFDEEF